MKNHDVREFVPPSVFAQFGQMAWQFVSDNIIRLHLFYDDFFNEYYSGADVQKVVVVCNNYHDPALIKILGNKFENRGLRTVKYINEQTAKGIKTAMLSQHVGGSTNATDFNVIIYYTNGKTKIVPSGEVYDVIMAHEKKFLAAGLTTLESKAMTPGWVHGDCRYTGRENLYIVNP